MAPLEAQKGRHSLLWCSAISSGGEREKSEAFLGSPWAERQEYEEREKRESASVVHEALV